MNIPRLVFAALGLVCGCCCAWQMHVQQQLLLLKEEVSGEFNRIIPRIIAASSTFFIITNIVEIVALELGSSPALVAIADFALGCCTLLGAHQTRNASENFIIALISQHFQCRLLFSRRPLAGLLALNQFVVLTTRSASLAADMSQDREALDARARWITLLFYSVRNFSF